MIKVAPTKKATAHAVARDPKAVIEAVIHRRGKNVKSGTPTKKATAYAVARDRRSAIGQERDEAVKEIFRELNAMFVHETDGTGRSTLTAFAVRNIGLVYVQQWTSEDKEFEVFWPVVLSISINETFAALGGMVNRAREEIGEQREVAVNKIFRELNAIGVHQTHGPGRSNLTSYIVPNIGLVYVQQSTGEDKEFEIYCELVQSIRISDTFAALRRMANRVN